MSRNTNLEQLLFPVVLKPVYIMGNGYNKLSNYSAVSGRINGKENIFSIVSKDYTLILNYQALSLGKSIFRKIFPESGDEDFNVFNIIYPSTRSYCHIDLINKNYTLNIWDNEVYVPFIRITNSYNKLKKLRFELGFCRQVCDNGVIFEREFVSLNYSHYKNSLHHIQKFTGEQLKLKKLHAIEDMFIGYMRNLERIKIEEKYFIPVTAKIFGLKFNIENVSEQYRKIIEKQREEFLNILERLKRKYTGELGETAYSLFNTATAFANEEDFVKGVRYNDYQTKAGQWVKEIVRFKNESIIQQYLDSCIDYLN